MAAPRRRSASRPAKGGRKGSRSRRRSLRDIPTRTLRTGLIAAAAVVLLVGGALWLRDSALFSVDHVEVSGLSGPSAPRIKAALRDATGGMTTMHIDESKLRRAVDGFPQVRNLTASRKGTHELRVHVVEWVPVGAVSAQGRRIPVAADGTLLQGLVPDSPLATVPIGKVPNGRRLSDGRGRTGVALLAAAPPQLRGRVERVGMGARGLSVTLREGPDLYFGTPERLGAKWLAAVAVLADQDAKGAKYVDLTVPEHPAAGGVQQTALPGEEGLTADNPATANTDESGLSVDGTGATTPDSANTQSQVQG